MKAILITDMPSTCAYCDFCHTKEYDSRHKLDGEKFCGILNEDVKIYYHYGTKRPKMCPLKEISKSINGNIPDIVDFYSYVRGWNDCIDEILGE